MSGKQLRNKPSRSSRPPSLPLERDSPDPGTTSRRTQKPNQRLITTASPDPEPRRSVRATKGQHKALEQLDQPLEAPKRRGKKGKKAAAEPEEQEEEVIRCVCGATDQDDDQADETWIACDSCGVWQHNICLGLSLSPKDLPKQYFCEECKPENHKDLLLAMARGEKPWEVRRKLHEDQSDDKKKKGPKKGGRKRVSDTKDVAEDVAKSSQKSKSSPMPEPKEPKEPKEAKVAKSKEPKESKEAKEPKRKETDSDGKTGASAGGQKRKAAEHPQEKEPKVCSPPSPTLVYLSGVDADRPQKARKVSDTQESLQAEQEIVAKIHELPITRQNSVKALSKSISHSIKATELTITNPTLQTARFAMDIEQAVFDSHPNNSTAYANQARTLTFNLKNNPALCSRLLAGTLTATMLAAMATEELAPEEMQQSNAVIKARAEKQAIKITEEVPRIRKTHKGDELVEENTPMAIDEEPPARPPAPREHARSISQSSHKAGPNHTPDLPTDQGASRSATRDLAVDTQHSPSRPDFDINKVFSSVKSPTLPQPGHRLSLSAAPAAGPGIDPDVDRLLDDGSQSPPYSPRAEDDPDVVWKGRLVMNTVGTVPVSAKYIGGADLNKSLGLPWTTLIPSQLSVCGRIDQEQAVVYLCGLRFSPPTDVVVISLEPTHESAKAEFTRVIDYFVGKKRYGVIGDKGIGNVRDTYLVPVLPGQGGHPEFMLNLVDNFIPETRTEPMLLAVFVYRNDPDNLLRVNPSAEAGQAMRPQDPKAQNQQLAYGLPPETPTPMQPGIQTSGHRHSIASPGFSPTSPQGAFPNTPTQGTAPGSHYSPSQPPRPPAQPAREPDQLPINRKPPAPAQMVAEALAREVLGPLIASPTVQFLLPQAQSMVRPEWELIRKMYQTDPKTRVDLPHLSAMLELHSSNPPSSPPPPPAAVVTPVYPPAPALRHTPIPPPPIPHAAAAAPPARPAPARQTPIPPPPIPPQAAAAAGAPPG